jgi:hypothetical protein
MSFREETQADFMDMHHLVTKDFRPTTKWTFGNSLLITSAYYLGLYLRGEATPADVALFSQTVDACWSVPGCLNRNPGRFDERQSQDDYYGVTAASYFFNTPHAKLIEQYGEKNFWCYDNKRPNKLYWDSWDRLHYRFPGLVGHYKLCARQSPGPLQALLIPAAIFSAAVSDPRNLDARIKTWFMVEVARAQKQLNCLEAIECWDASLKKNYGSMGKVFGLYLENPRHALAKYL